jgi:hypothetical protein
VRALTMETFTLSASKLFITAVEISAPPTNKLVGKK